MNMLKTTLLMAALTGILIAIGGAIGGSTGAMVMFVISLGLNFYTYWNSDTMCLRAYNARVITREEAPNLYDLVERLAERAQLPLQRRTGAGQRKQVAEDLGRARHLLGRQRQRRFEGRQGP